MSETHQLEPFIHYTIMPHKLDIPTTPVVPILQTWSNPPDKAALQLFTNIIAFVDDAADLSRLSLTSKAVHVPAMKRLWSGEFFPAIGYFSLAAGRFLLVDSAKSRWFILEILRTRADLAELVSSFKITEGQESIEQLPILPNLRELVIEHRGRREQNSGYHDNRLIEFLRHHIQIEELTLIGATYDESEMDSLVLPAFSRLELHFSQMPNWLSVTPTQLTHLTLMACPSPTLWPLADPTPSPRPDPTPFKFPDDRTLTFLSPSLGGLQYLNVSCCVDISAAGLSVVLHQVPELRTLALHFCQKLDVAASLSRRPNLSKLEHLILNCKIRCGATITSFSAYSGEKRSQAIVDVLSPTPPPSPGLGNPNDEPLPRGPNLVSITISGQTTLWERRILLPGFVAAHCSTLRKICLEENMIDMQELKVVCEKCQQLEELWVKNPSDLHDPTLTESILARAPKLRRVVHATGRYVVKRFPDNPDSVELVLV
ncbi:hypothetical protein FRB99_000804 [Tulasnella sp. 403]|nr:hypothetical protein FRB99_000804 [Tulasnella sp. 403]